ncbi:nucleoside recognition domain-containing protein [Castellaniella sp. GW247-6E4]|uniref:nucleoside recognition domain-containing protein n=1 Tax=Castellaniella sp. GW247-6E4 TaxID=3140380 RepID=UPI003315969A
MFGLDYNLGHSGLSLEGAPMTSILDYPRTIALRSLRMFLTIARIMVPVMVLVYIAQRLGLIAVVGDAIAPAMALLGLPPEAGIIWATTILTNIYGGLASMAALSDDLRMNVAQISALGAMMLFAHNVPTEQSVVRRAGASALFTGALRVTLGALYGAAVTWACDTWGWLREPVSLDWMRQDSALAGGTPDVWSWLWSSTQSLAMILVIIVFLVCFLDILERLGVTRLVTRLLTPLLRLSGLEERAAPLTTVGVLLGLAYGGALIIEATEREGYSARTRLLALSWLSLCHALIEDTLLILTLGADIWVILVIRTTVTLAVLAGLARLTLPGAPLARLLKL